MSHSIQKQGVQLYCILAILLLIPFLILGEDINQELIKAAGRGDIKAVEKWLKAGADVNATAAGGVTPLMSAAEEGHYEIVKLLIDKGADLEVREKLFGATVLFNAAYGGYTDIVKLLLKNGAQVNAKTTNGYTSLIFAAEKGHADIVKLLIENGASVNDKTKKGKTALNQALTRGYTEIVQMLKDAGAAAEDTGAIRKIDLFVKKFNKALEANDRGTAVQLVRRAKLIIYEVVRWYAVKGIERIAEGKDGASYLEFAGKIASLYGNEFGKKGLLELVRNYKRYNRQMGGEYLRGRTFFREGISLQKKGQWSDALKKYNEAGGIFETLNDADSRAAVLNNIGIIYTKQGKYKKALEYVQRALKTAVEIGNADGETDALTNIGNIHWSLGRYQEALHYFKQSHKLNQKIGDISGQARALTGIGNVLYNQGHHTKAIDSYRQSLAMVQKMNDFPTAAKNLANIAACYGALGRYEEALDFSHRALEISRKIKDFIGEADAATVMGQTAFALGQHKKAFKCFDQALAIYRKAGAVSQEARIYRDIGSYHLETGHYGKVEDHYLAALGIFRKTGQKEDEAGLLNKLGRYFHYLGQYHKAIEYYQRAFGIFQDMGNKRGESDSLNNTGAACHLLGQDRKAQDFFKRALEIDRKSGDKKRTVAALNNMGLTHKSLGQYTKALEYYRQALEIERSSGAVNDSCAILNNIGKIYYILKNYPDSIKFLEKSLKISQQIGDREVSWRAASLLARTLWKSGRPESAVSHYRKAIRIIEELYHSTEGLREEERSSMMGGKSVVYQEFIELLMELHRTHPGQGHDKQAFVISEKAKSRIFQAMMAKARARTTFSGDEIFKKLIEMEPRLISAVINLRQNLIREQSKPVKERNEEVVASLKEQLSKAEISLKGLEKELNGKYPRYADLKRPQALTVEKLQEIIKPGETVLAYSVGKNKTAAFIIGKQRFKLIEIETGAEELAGLIKKFRRGIDNVHEIRHLEKFKPETAYSIYQKIFRPVLPELKKTDKIYLSADNILYTLPFEALVDRKIDIKVFRNARKKGRRGEGDYLGEYQTLHYLIDRYTISYLPSASVLRSLRKYEKPGYGKWVKSLIAFADPVFSGEEKNEERDGPKAKGIKSRGLSRKTEQMLAILIRSTGIGRLERLPDSATEARDIAGELKGREQDIYLREKASEENLYKADLKGARYLLFSTHGLLGGDFSGVAEPSLALTLINNPPDKDGFLAMSEVLGLDLNAELIILSACNTYGQGEKAGRGEGFAGLTRSFMYAGGKALLVTYWSVDSQAARDLMVNTFKQMKHESIPGALRKAKLMMKKSTRLVEENSKLKLSLSHPFFWAPYVLVGVKK